MKYTCHILLYVSLVHLAANHNYSCDLPLRSIVEIPVCHYEVCFLY